VSGVLVTGCLGFILSNLMHRESDVRLIGVDRAVHSYNLDNMAQHPDQPLYLADVADAHIMDRIFMLERPSIVIHGAAESFVDDAIRDAVPFVRSNVLGTQVMADACVKYGARLIHISTDEVYGQQTKRAGVPWTEEVRMSPRNPYSASKAAAELVVHAAGLTHGLRYNIVRSCNVYGPRQKKENLIPHVLHGLIEQRPIRIHGQGNNFRQYIYVDDMLDGVLTVMHRGSPGETYNIGGDDLVSNLEMVECLAKQLGRRSLVQHIEDRKAHDFGYHVDSRKLRKLGWAPKVKMADGLKRVTEWYRKSVGAVYAC
jgi:dTDP-glucose 4,6-dehydratase